MTLQTALYQLIGFALYPLWLAAGAGDYLCHRRTKLEVTSGLPESQMHVAQYVCIAVTVIAAVFFSFVGSVLYLVATAVAVHTALSYFDVRYTFSRRVISPLEQHIHAVLCIVPIVAVVLLAMADAVSANQASLLRSPPLSPMLAGLIIGSIVILSGAPLVEEFIRSFRATKQSAQRLEFDSGLSNTDR